MNARLSVEFVLNWRPLFAGSVGPNMIWTQTAKRNMAEIGTHIFDTNHSLPRGISSAMDLLRTPTTKQIVILSWIYGWIYIYIHDIPCSDQPKATEAAFRKKNAKRRLALMAKRLQSLTKLLPSGEEQSIKPAKSSRVCSGRTRVGWDQLQIAKWNCLKLSWNSLVWSCLISFASRTETE